MNLKRTLGLDILKDKYAYATDAVTGYTSAQKIPDDWVSTTCGYCSVGCGMFVGVKDGRAVSVRGNPDHKANMGTLCPKGLSEHYTLEAENRARYPLLRKNGKLVRVTWDEALTTMADKFKGVQQKYGPDAVGVLSTGQLVTEEFYTLGKLVQLGFGSKNYDGNTTLCMSSAVSGYKRSFGSDGPPGSYEDLAIADVIFLIGANIADNHPILCQWVDANPDKTLMVADPRVTKTAMMADFYLPLKPRSDIALINGMIHLLIENNLVDREYIARHTSGFEALEESVRSYTPEYVSGITGLTPEQIFKAAWIYGHARAPFIGWTMGVNHSTKGTETVNAINNLALVTGNIGRPGASPFSITGQCNAMGSRETRFTSSLPGYRKFENAEGSPGVGRALGHSCGAHPHFSWTGLSGHHRSGAGKKNPRPLGDRHQPDCFLSEFGRAARRAWKTWSFSSCRTAFIPRPPRKSPTWFCPRRSGAKRKAPTRIRSGASAR